MQLKSLISFSTIIFLLLFTPIWSVAESFQENPLTKAIQLFDKEKYSDAEPIFKKILDDRPDDFMVNYFYGACRTENGHYSDQDLNYLIKASKEVTPLNIDFYFAVQYHAKNQWEKALTYYKLYKAVASANDQKKAGLSLKMEQCSNKINPFIATETNENIDKTETPIVGAEGVTAVAAESSEKTGEILPVPKVSAVDSANTVTEENSGLKTEEKEISEENDSTMQITEPEPDTLSVSQPEENQGSETDKTLPAEEQIEFSINNEITYITVSNFKTAEGQIYFKEGRLKQTEFDEIVKETEELREKYKTSKSRLEKDSIGQRILAMESQTYELKSVVIELFLQAKTVENGYWQNATPGETESFIRELNSAREIYKKNKINTETFSETQQIIIPPILIDNEEVERAVPKTKTSGIIYKIQLGAYSRGIPNNLRPVFKKISLIRKVENYTDEKGVVVYTTGNLTNFEDAVLMQTQVRQEGIKDPIIAAYLNGKRITLEQAKKIVKQK